MNFSNTDRATRPCVPRRTLCAPWQCPVAHRLKACLWLQNRTCTERTEEVAYQCSLEGLEDGELIVDAVEVITVWPPCTSSALRWSPGRMSQECTYVCASTCAALYRTVPTQILLRTWMGWFRWKGYYLSHRLCGWNFCILQSVEHAKNNSCQTTTSGRWPWRTEG